MTQPIHHIALINALYPNGDSGLVSDLLSARALGAVPLPVCSSIISASPEHVTDVSEVPADTVEAQLQHLARTSPPDGYRLGVLGTHQTVEVVAKHLARVDRPVILDVSIEGEAGSTVMTPRGVAALKKRLDMATLVVASTRDAELLSEGEITSLDDAQVAAQRLSRRGANAVLIKCGTLPARHFDSETSREAGQFMTDLFFDGTEFGLFEAPLVESTVRGASSALSVSILAGMLNGLAQSVAIQHAKRYVTEGLRRAVRGRFAFDWDESPRVFPN